MLVRLGALACFAAGVIMMVGCPPREVRIQVTDGGISLIRSSCLCQGAGCCTRIDPGSTTENVFDVQVHLLEVDENSQHIVASSACIESRKIEFLVRDSQLEGQADVLNAAIADAVGPEGLGLDGLDDPHDVYMLLTLHIPVPGKPCSREGLFVCAGLDEPLPDAGFYDVFCSSCRGGLAGFTSKSEPCREACYVDRSCAELFPAAT